VHVDSKSLSQHRTIGVTGGRALNRSRGSQRPLAMPGDLRSGQRRGRETRAEQKETRAEQKETRAELERRTEAPNSGHASPGISDI
jgi:hypothetical protein